MLHRYDRRPRTINLSRRRAHAPRRSGLRCLTIEIREAEVAELIRRGLLKPETRNDHNAIIEALYVHLERSLGSMP